MFLLPASSPTGVTTTFAKVTSVKVQVNRGGITESTVVYDTVTELNVFTITTHTVVLRNNPSWLYLTAPGGAFD